MNPFFRKRSTRAAYDVLNREAREGVTFYGAGDSPHWEEGGTATEAMRQVRAVYSCVALIADAIAAAPCILYRRTDDGGYEEATNHPLHDILRYSPAADIGACNWIEMMVRSLLLYGNAYSRVLTDRGGDVKGLIPFDPRYVQILRHGKYRQGKLYYRATDTFRKYGTSYILGEGEMLHIPGRGYDGLKGYSPIREAAGAVAHAAAIRAYGKGFLDNGAVPTMVLETENKLSDKVKESITEAWQRKYGGKNRHKTAVLEFGITAKTLGVSPEDTQLIEMMKWSVSDVCGIFHVPPHLVADLEKATFSNIEAQGRHFYTVTLLPWLTRLEQAIENQLLLPEERSRYYVEFDLTAILRGDQKTRYDAYRIGRQWGWLSPNDIRRKEKLPPLTEDQGGDQYLVPLNMVPAEDAGEGATSGGGGMGGQNNSQ